MIIFPFKKFALSAVMTATITAYLSGMSSAQAATLTLDFEGVGNLKPIDNFYNTTPRNYGVAFSSNALGVVDSDVGGTGNIGGEPSPSTALVFTSGTAARMNVINGFTTRLSFFYSMPDFPGVVTIWGGLNGTGKQLAQINLALTPQNGAPDPTGYYSPFVAQTVAFQGIARSVDFGGATNYIAYDDITLGNVLPAAQVPTPALLPGLIGLGVGAWRKRRAASTHQDKS